LDQIVRDDADFIAVICYHVWWPDPGNDPYYAYNSAENATRNNYYGNGYTPHFFVDGDIDAGSNSGAWRSQLENEIIIDAAVSMTLSGTFNRESLTGNLNIRGFVESSPGLNNLKLRVALTESGLYYIGSNGLRWHNQVFRDMIPSTGGLGITLIEGDSIEYNFSYSVPSPIRPDSSFLIAFIQSDQTRRVVQAAKIRISDLTAVGIDDQTPTPRLFSLAQNYPNPFNGQTTISFNTDGGETSLEIFDLSGARVATLLDRNLGSGSYNLVWNGQDENGKAVSSGTYFYRLKDDSGASIKKMTMLK
jgi:hypothetical protein